MKSLLSVAAAGMIITGPAFGQGERNKARLLYGFEKEGDVKQLLGTSEHVDIIAVQDYGVTEGKNCARVVGKRGQRWALFTLGRGALKNWADFDYFAMDVHSEKKLSLNFELWDANSKNYATRCTSGGSVNPGQNTLLFKINRSKRNNKEGRSWEELKPQDKIKMNGLTQVKIFFTPRKDGGDTVSRRPL